jgi:hypothetical protein
VIRVCVHSRPSLKVDVHVSGAPFNVAVRLPRHKELMLIRFGFSGFLSNLKHCGEKYYDAD